MKNPEKILTTTDLKEIFHFPTNKGSEYFLDSIQSQQQDTDNMKVEKFNDERLLVFDKEIWEMFTNFVKTLNLAK